MAENEDKAEKKSGIEYITEHSHLNDNEIEELSKIEWKEAKKSIQNCMICFLNLEMILDQKNMGRDEAQEESPEKEKDLAGVESYSDAANSLHKARILLRAVQTIKKSLLKKPEDFDTINKYIDEAMASVDEAEKSFDADSIKNTIEKAFVYHVRGNVFFEKREFELAKENYAKAKKIFEEHNIKEKADEMGTIFLERCKIKTASEELEKLIKTYGHDIIGGCLAASLESRTNNPIQLVIEIPSIASKPNNNGMRYYARKSYGNFAERAIRVKSVDNLSGTFAQDAKLLEGEYASLYALEKRIDELKQPKGVAEDTNKGEIRILQNRFIGIKPDGVYAFVPTVSLFSYGVCVDKKIAEIEYQKLR